MARTVEEIVELLRIRQLAQGPMLAKMREIKSAYEGDVIIPLPELDQANKPAVANLLNQGLDQMSMRVASVMPDVYYPPVRPGIEKSEKAARIRRLANIAWWNQNHMRVKMRRRSRWLVGYGAAPVVIRPDYKNEMPMWHLRDPLSTFPAPSIDLDDMTPPDCIFSFSRSYAWLKQNYPDEVNRLYRGPKPKGDDVYELVEYIDDEEIVLLCRGKQPAAEQLRQGESYETAVELERVPNRIGMCPVVIPGRIGLDRRMSQFEGMLGMYMLQARLAALEVIAVEKGVFPDTYLISRPNEIASFISGPYDGRTGLVNIIKGGDIREVQTNPGFQTNPTIDRLERGQRLTAGIPAEFGGESTTNVRTGRRGDSILSAVVNFPLQEAHELFSEALQQENKIAIAIVREYFDTPKSFYLAVKGHKGRVDYNPSQHFDSDVNFVTYSQAGVDLNNLIIGMGQRIGVGTMSKRSAQELDPLIEDAESEHDRVISEALEQAMLGAIQTQASDGTIAPIDVATIMRLVVSDRMELAEAVEEAQRLAQERQAASGPPGAPDGPAAMPGAPEAQVGLQAGPEGAAVPMDQVGPPPQSLQNLGQMLNSLRNTSSMPTV